MKRLLFLLWVIVTLVGAQPASAANHTLTPVDLGTLGGSFSSAFDLNDHDHVVGFSQTTSGATHAFLWEAGVMTDLDTGVGGFSRADAINNHGQIVGVSQ